MSNLCSLPANSNKNACISASWTSQPSQFTVLPVFFASSGIVLSYHLEVAIFAVSLVIDRVFDVLTDNKFIDLDETDLVRAKRNLKNDIALKKLIMNTD